MIIVSNAPHHHWCIDSSVIINGIEYRAFGPHSRILWKKNYFERFFVCITVKLEKVNSGNGLIYVLGYNDSHYFGLFLIKLWKYVIFFECTVTAEHFFRSQTRLSVDLEILCWNLYTAYKQWNQQVTSSQAVLYRL